MSEEKKEPSFLEKTLLRGSFQGVVGANALGVSDPIYNLVMKNPEIMELREEDYQKKLQEYKHLGVAGNPSYMQDTDLSELVLKQIDVQMRMAKFGELYDIMQKMGKSFESKLPEQIKNLSFDSIFKKGTDEKTGKFDEKKLSEDEKIGLSMYNEFAEFYRNTCKGSTINKFAYQDMNSSLKAVWEKYNPTPKEETPKK
jgi:hypothetical protein